MSDVILRTEEVRKVYRQGETDLTVLKGVTMGVRGGEILAIVGPSGAGKSTLLHLLGFLDRPTSGDVVFGGTRLSEVKETDQAAIRNRHFGFVFQLYHLLPELTALENAMVPLMIRYDVGTWVRRGGEAKEKCRRILTRLGLADRLEHRPNQLSGGEQQRLAIARAIVGDPEVVLCDEPTGSLDRATAGEIRSLIVELNRETGRTFVLVTHDEETAALADRRLRIVDGLLVDGEG